MARWAAWVGGSTTVIQIASSASQVVPLPPHIWKRAPPACQQAMVDNPREFATAVVRIIKDCLAEQLMDGIRYERIDAWYEMAQFETSREDWAQYLVPSQRPDGKPGASLYDQVPADSLVERSSWRAWGGGMTCASM